MTKEDQYTVVIIGEDGYWESNPASLKVCVEVKLSIALNLPLGAKVKIKGPGYEDPIDAEEYLEDHEADDGDSYY